MPFLKAVNYLIEEVAEMRALLDKMEKQLDLGINKHRPILIEQAAEILQMKIGTVRRLVNDQEIPHYKREHNIYFFEDELIKWIEDSKIKPISHTSFYEKNRRICNYLRIKRLFGLLENWVTR